MALTTRGKALIAGGAVVAVLGGGVAALALTGDNPVAKARRSRRSRRSDAPHAVPAHEPAGRRGQGAAGPPRARRQGGEHARRDAARGPGQGRRRLRRGRRRRHHAVHRGLQLFERRACRPGAQRPHHRPQDPAAVQPPSAARLLGRREPGREDHQGVGRGGHDRGRPRAAVHPRRCARGAAQPVRQHEQALGGRPEARQGRARARGDLQLRRPEQAQQEDHLRDDRVPAHRRRVALGREAAGSATRTARRCCWRTATRSRPTTS